MNEFSSYKPTRVVAGGVGVLAFLTDTLRVSLLLKVKTSRTVGGTGVAGSCPEVTETCREKRGLYGIVTGPPDVSAQVMVQRVLQRTGNTARNGKGSDKYASLLDAMGKKMQPPEGGRATGTCIGRGVPYTSRLLLLGRLSPDA
ncbi:Ethanolamine-phosphate cytidylyltransferase [Anopheles sinensis]|uniref:Ethanolamine-phosphate cytidylyltransferase n=1 Tax=Anopheles sinensis TaxID=74873 RepID=A0A084W1V1_ANOSI|nr:Ethanolamine-phosphate cytidylyltransferase [Anopheles sinensis]